MVNPSPTPAIDANTGIEIHRLLTELFPLHRSQTGNGNRETFARMQRLMQMEIIETPSRSDACGWTIPDEWKVNDAHISFDGKRIVDYHQSNLHILNGSAPLQGQFSFEQLKPYLTYDKAKPDSIPYRTAFFRDAAGFSVTYRQYQELESLKGPFEVSIETEFHQGSMTHAEIHLPGSSDSTFLIWAHCCHPSLGNDNLAGMGLALFLAKHLQAAELRRSFRIVFAPATIGAINWIHLNQPCSEIDGGLVLSLLGGESPFHYKSTRDGDSETDRILNNLLGGNPDNKVLPFEPFGYDERQFGSPGLNLPVGRLTRDVPNQFPQYHTSDDNLERISPESLESTLGTLLEITSAFNLNRTLINQRPNVEPFLQPYDLYRRYGNDDLFEISPEAIMWTLNLSDGKHDLVAISDRSGLPFDIIAAAANRLEEIEILKEKTAR